MTRLEIALICLSIVESVVTCVLYVKHRKVMNAAIAKANAKEAEYELAIKQVNIWRNAT